MLIKIRSYILFASLPILTLRSSPTPWLFSQSCQRGVLMHYPRVYNINHMFFTARFTIKNFTNNYSELIPWRLYIFSRVSGALKHSSPVLRYISIQASCLWYLKTKATFWKSTRDCITSLWNPHYKPLQRFGEYPPLLLRVTRISLF